LGNLGRHVQMENVSFQELYRLGPLLPTIAPPQIKKTLLPTRRGPGTQPTPRAGVGPPFARLPHAPGPPAHPPRPPTPPPRPRRPGDAPEPRHRQLDPDGRDPTGAVAADQVGLVVGGGLAGGRRGLLLTAPERQHVGGGERGGIGSGIGTRSRDDGPAKAGCAECEHRRHDHDRHELDGNRAPLAAHRSTRIDTRACSSGSGNNGPTRGRFVTDRYDTSTVIGSPTRCRSPTSTSAPRSVRRAARSARPGSRSTLAARAASRAAWTTAT